jgi:cell division protein FtsW (lipid II flippase)
LLRLAAVFMVLYALALTISPAVRARSWLVEYRWDHWLGVAVWALLFTLAHRQVLRRLPTSDPYLLPVVALLSGWGLMVVWRLLPGFGLRQTVWLGLGLVVFIAGLRLDSELRFLRRYKYLWLFGSLALTALTLIVGINPMGFGPKMWLGCCGVYLQPSEPLKLLLIAYLAAYLAERYPFSVLSTRRTAWLPLLAPTFLMTGLALALLVIQRDLGTAFIFFFLYAAIVYTASGNKQVLVIALVGVILAVVGGYTLFDVVRIRVDGWLNPWLDPSGRSFQIVQSLLAIANGGIFGRGPGLGNPGLVPLVHSDLVYAAIAEEHGLLGSAALMLLLALLAGRGLRTALLAADPYRRYLATGVTAFLIGQSVVIIGGSLRLLPLTGITLPFISYGGSSLVTCLIAALLLLHSSTRPQPASLQAAASQAYRQLGVFFLVALAAAAIASGWWAVARGPELLARTDNARRAIADRSTLRGAIYDRNNSPISISIGEPGNYVRRILAPDLSNVVGYTNPTYGQAGLEASLDGYLRGVQGHPTLTIWWSHILYGYPPPGLDVRLSLDLGLQSKADQLLAGQRGALVLLNAQNGEIFAMASHPTFDANYLEENWLQLIQDQSAPLFNRAVLGRYPVGAWQGAGGTGWLSPALPASGQLPVPAIRLPAGLQTATDDSQPGYSPLQLALLAAAISQQGMQPAPLLVIAVETPGAGWVFLPALSQAQQISSAVMAMQLMEQATLTELNIWQSVLPVAIPGAPGVTWYLGGSLPDWGATPVAVALLLETQDLVLAEMIGQEILRAAMQP